MVHFLARPAGTSVTAPGALMELTKAAPYFRPLDAEIVELSTTSQVVGDLPVEVRRQQIDREVELFEVTWLAGDVLAPDAVGQRAQVQQWLRAHAGITDAPGGLFEEYVVVCIAEVAEPDSFVRANERALRALIRQEAHAVSRQEASQILVSRVRYSDEDLAIVDWDGAIVLDREGDFGSDLALLKLGNTQLMQYRMLDRRVNAQLEALRARLASPHRFQSSRRALRDMLRTRIDLLLGYEEVEQLVALIGDWYTADLYRVIVDEFYIDEWKATVRAKLDELQAIADSAGANLAMSWQQLLDLVQLTGWALLLIGYFVLFWMEAR